jgi:hypothetical protein
MVICPNLLYDIDHICSFGNITNIIDVYKYNTGKPWMNVLYYSFNSSLLAIFLIIYPTVFQVNNYRKKVFEYLNMLAKGRKI